MVNSTHHSFINLCVAIVILSSPIPGKWKEWGSWSRCSATCMGGRRERVRECDLTTHGDNTGPCVGEAKEFKDCNSYPCDEFVRTCSEMKGRGFVDTAWVEVDPDGKDQGVEPFYVWCNMEEEEGVGFTEISHQFTEDTYVHGKEGVCEYTAIVKYENATVSQVKALVDVSVSCTQDIQWRCKEAAITSKFTKTVKFTYWRNRDGRDRFYWDGADPNVSKCACGVRGDCVDPQKVCNCDVNDGVWRQDDGVLGHKQDLPVTVFCAGDTGSPTEEGYFKLGKLKCTGTNK